MAITYPYQKNNRFFVYEYVNEKEYVAIPWEHRACRAVVAYVGGLQLGLIMFYVLRLIKNSPSKI
jgi:hypothetical protein